MSSSTSMIPAYDAQERLSLETLAETVGLHIDLINRFVEYGLVEPVERRGALVLFETSAAVRIRTIERLRHDLGVNLPGIGIILELRDRVEALKREIDWLRGKP